MFVVFIVFIGLVLLALVTLIMCLVSPKAVLGDEKTPTRLKIAAIGLGWIGVFFVGVVLTAPEPETVAAVQQAETVASTPAPEPVQPQAVAKPTSPVLEEKAEAAPTQVGLGITRKEAIQIFSKLDFNQAPSSPVDGQERWMGQSKYGMSQIIGPEDNVSSLFLMCMVINDEDDPKVSQESAMVASLRVNVLLRSVFPNWNESVDWVNKAVEKKGDEITIGNKMASIKIIEALGSITVRITPDV